MSFDITDNKSGKTVIASGSVGDRTYAATSVPLARHPTFSLAANTIKKKPAVNKSVSFLWCAQHGRMQRSVVILRLLRHK